MLRDLVLAFAHRHGLRHLLSGAMRHLYARVFVRDPTLASLFKNTR